MCSSQGGLLKSVVKKKQKFLKTKQPGGRGGEGVE